jgi:hypothetical protein
VLLDGATARSGADSGCLHGVAWYARSLGAALLAAITATPRVPLPDALAAAIGEVRARHAGSCDLTRPDTPAATVTAVRAEPGGIISYLALSDSSVVADYDGGRPPLVITDRHPAARADPAAALAASTGRIGGAGLRGVALLSDGATRTADRFGLASWPALLATIRSDGPAALISQVRAAESADPDGERWPRLKRHDDATVLWWPGPA